MEKMQEQTEEEKDNILSQTFKNLKSLDKNFDSKLSKVINKVGSARQTSFRMDGIEEMSDEEEELIVNKRSNLLKGSVSSNLFEQPARQAANTMNAFEVSNMEGIPQMETVPDGQMIYMLELAQYASRDVIGIQPGTIIES